MAKLEINRDQYTHRNLVRRPMLYDRVFEQACANGMDTNEAVKYARDIANDPNLATPYVDLKAVHITNH